MRISDWSSDVCRPISHSRRIVELLVRQQISFEILTRFRNVFLSRALFPHHLDRRRTMNFIIWLIIGGILGWLASILMRTDAQQGILLNIVVGIVGAFLAGLVFSGGTINRGDFSLSALDRKSTRLNSSH